jgi:hypothetical protein
MKHPHTRAAVKQSAKDFGGIFKSASKWAKSTFVGIPTAFGNDIREHRASLKRYEEWLASQESTETPADAQ